MNPNWEYSFVSATYEENARQWSYTVRIPGHPRFEAVNNAWLVDVASELGAHGWELIDRAVTSTRGGSAYGWSLIFKREPDRERVLEQDQYDFEAGHSEAPAGAPPVPPRPAPFPR